MVIEKDGIRYGIVRACAQGAQFVPSKHLKGTKFFCDSFTIPVFSVADFGGILGFIEKTFKERDIQIGRAAPV